MKKLFTTIALSMLFFCCNAQVTFQVGAGGNAAFTSYHSNNAISASAFGFETKSLLTINPTVLFEVNIKNKVGIITGLQYLTKGLTYEIDFLGVSGKAKFSYRYYSVPLNITYNFLPKDKRLSAGIMVMADFSSMHQIREKTSGTAFSGSSSMDTSVNYSSDLTGINRFNLALGGGIFAAYNLNDHFNIMVYPFYKRDVIEISQGEGDGFTSYGIGATAFYRF